jgi:hypothetical protein
MAYFLISKLKVVPLCAVKLHKESGGIAPLFFNLGIRWEANGQVQALALFSLEK